MANIRIKDLTTDSALAAGDYVVVDSASEGSRKFDLGAELTSIKEDLVQIYVSGTSLIINGGIPNGEDVSY